MSQINPFRGIVVPSALPQRVQPQKDRQQRRQPREERKDQAAGEEEKPVDEGESHLDLKA